MGRPRNKVVRGFAKRLEWIINNLEPDPRICGASLVDIDEIFNVLESFEKRHDLAVMAEVFPSLLPGRKPSGASFSTWQNAVYKDNVSDFFIRWVCVLYPDVELRHLMVDSLDQFMSIGEPIRFARARWQDAIERYAVSRGEMAEVARQYYREIDYSKSKSFPIKNFPLLTKPGWIRKKPLQLNQFTEAQRLSEPGPIRKFSPPPLDGLKYEYNHYKGTKNYRAKRAYSKTKGPQNNGPALCVDRVLLEDDFIGFDYYRAHYFDYINTGEYLGVELADWMNRSNQDDSLTALPRRGRPEDAFDFSNRAAFLGVNCITVLLNYDDNSSSGCPHRFLLHRRDETQLQAQNCVAVLPAGGHQPFSETEWKKEDTSIWRTTVREFIEELFNEEKLIKHPDSWEDFLRIESVAKLAEFFFISSRPAATVHLFGFGLDPITLKPEALVSIVVDWGRAKRRGLKLDFNWEVQGDTPGKHRAVLVELSRENLLSHADGLRLVITKKGGEKIHLTTLPAAAAALRLLEAHFDLLIPASAC